MPLRREIVKCRWCTMEYKSIGWRDKHEMKFHLEELEAFHREEADGRSLEEDSFDIRVLNEDDAQLPPSPRRLQKEVFPDAGSSYGHDDSSQENLIQPYY